MADNDNSTTRYNSSEKPRTGSLDEKINQMRADRRENRPDSITEPIFYDFDKKRRNRNILLGVLAVLVVILLGIGAWYLVSSMGEEKEVVAEVLPVETPVDTTAVVSETENDQVLVLQQQLAASEFENLEREFQQIEVQKKEIVVDDSKMRDLQKKYDEARSKMEELRKQLKESENMNTAEIQKLTNEIKTLRDLIKHYLEEIDRLNKENEQLRAENKDLNERLEQASTTLAETQQEKEKLDKRMQLAEKLNVTGVSMSMLNKKSKNEKKIKNATQFVISFTIPQNNSTPPGAKNIYAVITTPEGQILSGGGSFSYDGGSVTASASKQIEYGGEEIGGIKMYYDIRNALNPGRYSVQLFCDGYALMSRPLELNFDN